MNTKPLSLKHQHRCNSECLALWTAIGWLFLGLLATPPLAAQPLDFQQVFNTHSVIMLLIDPESGQIIDANPAAVRFYGHDHATLTAMRIQQINTLSCEQVAEERALAAQEQRHYFIFRHEHADGTIRTVQVHSHPFTRDGRRLLLSMIHDITPGRHLEQGMWHYQQRLEELVDIRTAEALAGNRMVIIMLFSGLLVSLATAFALWRAIQRQRHVEAALLKAKQQVDIAQEQLQHQHHRLQSILDGTRVGTWEWNVQTGETVFNERWAEIIGYRLAELAPLSINTWMQFAHPDDLRRSHELLAEHFAGQRDFYDFETRMRHRDGRWIWVQDRGRVATWTEDGKPLLMSGTHQDITARKQAEQELLEWVEHLRKLGAELPGVIYQYLLRADGSSAFIYASEGIRAIYGVTPEQVQDDATAVFAVLHEDDSESVSESIVVSAWDLTPWQAIYRVHHPDKGMIWVESHATPERLDDGSTLWHGYTHDVTDREYAQRQLVEREAKYRTLVENAPVIIYRCEVAPPRKMLHISQGAENLCGYASDEFLAGALDWATLVHPDDRDRLEQAVAAAVSERHAFEIEYRIVRADGAVRWVHETGSPHTVDEWRSDLCLQGIITDITERKNDQLQLQRSAHYDALTGLPNRVLLIERLEQAIERVQRLDHRLAVVFIDLDHFKPINDQHGHAIGDAVLVALAERMHQSLRHMDTLVRLGGDEFVAVLSDLTEQSDTPKLVQRLLEACSAPLDINGLTLHVSASIGVTFYPQATAQNPDQLLAQADQAMYHAKMKGKNRWHQFDA